MKKLFQVVSFGVSVLLFGQGCASTFGIGESKPVQLDGGLYVSENGGIVWQHRVLIPTVSGQPGTIASVNIATLVVDPTDRKTLYAGTKGNGMIYTYDQGRTWHQPNDVRTGTVTSIVVDPTTTCRIYVAVQHQILKSEDCSRTFNSIYVDQNPSAIISYLTMDAKQSKVLYAGTQAGVLLKSETGGKTWISEQRFESPIQKIFSYPLDPNILYVGLTDNGIRNSADKGKTWLTITPSQTDYSRSKEFRGLAWDVRSDIFYMYSGYGIFSSQNGGDTWTPLSLITAPGEATIYSFAVNPDDSNKLVYATAVGQTSTLVFSADRGKTWTTQKAPTTRALGSIVFDTEAPQIIYIAGFALSQ